MPVWSASMKLSTRAAGERHFRRRGAGAAIATRAMADAAPARPNANRPSLCERFMDVLPKAQYLKGGALLGGILIRVAVCGNEAPHGACRPKTEKSSLWREVRARFQSSHCKPEAGSCCEGRRTALSELQEREESVRRRPAFPGHDCCRISDGRCDCRPGTAPTTATLAPAALASVA